MAVVKAKISEVNFPADRTREPNQASGLRLAAQVAVQVPRVWTDAELLEAEAKLLQGLVDGAQALEIEDALYRLPPADCI
jgi:hypothetical protein